MPTAQNTSSAPAKASRGRTVRRQSLPAGGSSSWSARCASRTTRALFSAAAPESSAEKRSGVSFPVRLTAAPPLRWTVAESR